MRMGVWGGWDEDGGVGGGVEMRMGGVEMRIEGGWNEDGGVGVVGMRMEMWGWLE